MRKFVVVLIFLFLSFSMSWSQTLDHQAYQKGVDLYNQGDLDNARSTFSEFVNTYGSSEYMPNVYMYLARLEMNPDHAIKYFEKILQEHPSHSFADDALLGLAQYDYAKKNYKKAADLYHRITVDYPQSDLCSEAAYWSANSLYMADEIELAKNALNSAITSYPLSEKASWALLDLAYIYQQRKDFKTAIEKYQQLIREYPNSDVMSVAYYRYGESLSESGRKRESLTAYQRVLENYPESFEAAMVRGKNLDFSILDKPVPNKTEKTPQVTNVEPSPPPRVEPPAVAKPKMDTPPREAVDVTPSAETPTLSNDKRTYGSASGEQFHIQIGAYSSSENAQLLKSTIQDAETEITIVQVDSGGGKILYRVWVGNYRSREEAKLSAENLVKNKGIRNYIIVSD
ncbi:MAG: hypothetical protein B6244_04400 [Candidatus Cloacimonetes bacterium 4572_55]|nr:MAG: hypothetical protein B6244_04400 [Candidatus Cloacimonetes bacterium 4572_55]